MTIYYDVIRRILELAEVTRERLEYIHEQMKHGKGDQTLLLFLDVVNAFAEDEKFVISSGRCWL